jgi:putative salt-induced outer membrane protein YdiY
MGELGHLLHFPAQLPAFRVYPGIFMSRLLHTLAVGAALIVLPLQSQAFLSIENDEIGAPHAGTSGLLSGAIDGHSGNTDFQDYSLGGRLHYQAGVTGMFIQGEYDKARVQSQNIEEATWLHAGYRDEFQHGLAAEAFVDYLKNNFRGVGNRTQLGLGPRFTLDYTPDDRGVYAGIGILHEWENQADVNKDYWRLNSYLSYKRQLTPETRVLFDAAWQPRMGQSEDYLASSELAVVVKMATSADIKLGLKYSYDNRPVPGVKRDDTVYATSVNYRF